MDHMNLENSRIKQLDGLLGLAVLFVVAFHYINNQISIGLADQQSATTFQKNLLKTTWLFNRVDIAKKQKINQPFQDFLHMEIC
jgi:peptidoglycan/LPS O-acetylase OafA/YrhL